MIFYLVLTRFAMSFQVTNQPVFFLSFYNKSILPIFFSNPTYHKPWVTKITSQPIILFLLDYPTRVTPLVSFDDLTWIYWCFFRFIFVKWFFLLISSYVWMLGDCKCDFFQFFFFIVSSCEYFLFKKTIY